MATGIEALTALAALAWLPWLQASAWVWVLWPKGQPLVHWNLSWVTTVMATAASLASRSTVVGRVASSASAMPWPHLTAASGVMWPFLAPCSHSWPDTMAKYLSKDLTWSLIFWPVLAMT